MGWMCSVNWLIVTFVGGLLISCGGTPALGCDMKDLPLEIHEYIRAHFKEWRVVTLADLDPDHKLVYLMDHPNDCPGFTSGTYTSSHKLSFAVLLISNDKPGSYKLLVFDKGRETYNVSTLLTALNEGLSPVVFTEPAGTYLDWRREQRITTEHPAIAYVHYETSSSIFYWSEGKWRELQVSD